MRTVNSIFGCGVSERDIKKSVQVLKSFNPRINCREIEISPEYIFGQALKHWESKPNLTCAIETFFDSLNLEPVIYNDSADTLRFLKNSGYTVAALTDLPSAMPDKVFKSNIKELLRNIDIYVSSQSCGFRKPNPSGIYEISEKCGVKTEEILFVGDEEKDRKTAENAGCGFIFMDRDNKRTESVHNLRELISYINGN